MQTATPEMTLASMLQGRKGQFPLRGKFKTDASGLLQERPNLKGSLAPFDDFRGRQPYFPVH